LADKVTMALILEDYKKHIQMSTLSFYNFSCQRSDKNSFTFWDVRYIDRSFLSLCAGWDGPWRVGSIHLDRKKLEFESRVSHICFG